MGIVCLVGIVVINDCENNYFYFLKNSSSLNTSIIKNSLKIILPAQRFQ